MNPALNGLVATGVVLLLFVIIIGFAALGGFVGSRLDRPDGLTPEGLLFGGAIGFAVAFGVLVALTDAGVVR